MSHINMEQKILLKRIAYVNELSVTSAQTMTFALQQAKLAADRVSEGKNEVVMGMNKDIKAFSKLH